MNQFRDRGIERRRSKSWLIDHWLKRRESSLPSHSAPTNWRARRRRGILHNTCVWVRRPLTTFLYTACNNVGRPRDFQLSNYLPTISWRGATTRHSGGADGAEPARRLTSAPLSADLSVSRLFRIVTSRYYVLLETSKTSCERTCLVQSLGLKRVIRQSPPGSLSPPGFWSTVARRRALEGCNSRATFILKGFLRYVLYIFFNSIRSFGLYIYIYI